MGRILILGDSHAKAFEGIFPQGMHVVSVQGATAYGINNPDSMSQAALLFRKAIRTKDRVFCGVGETDCNTLIWQRAFNRGCPPEEELEVAIGRYLDFAKEVSTTNSFGFLAVLPTPFFQRDIPSDYGIKTVSREEVWYLTQTFNTRLRRYAEENDHDYLDINDRVLENGVINPRFVSSNDSHHLDFSATAPLWREELERRFGRCVLL